MRVLVTRPQPAAALTAAALAAHGDDVLVAPLLATARRRWQPPVVPPQALLITSANAVRHGGDLAAWHALPVFAVGAATAAALRAAGFADVRAGTADGAAALAAAHAAGVTRLLHLAGADRIPLTPPPGLSCETRTVYAARRARALPAAARRALAAGAIDVVLLYSPRSAAVFATLAARAGLARGGIALAALSANVAAAAGAGWRRIETAVTPDEAALFAAARRVCDKG